MKIEKIKSKLIILLVLPLVFLSCNLEEEIPDSVTGAAEVEAGAASLGPVFNSFNAAFQSQGSAYALQTHPTDELIGPTRGVDWSDFGVWRSLHTHTWDGSHPQIIAAWNNLHQGVVRANAAISGFGSAGDTENEAKSRFLRAYLLWQLVDMFGSIPFRDENNTDFISIPPVLSRAEATTFIIEDLEASLGNLPDYASGTYGEPTKEAAWALLSKLYINKFVYDDNESPSSEDLDNAIENADNVIDAGIFSLAPGDQYFTANFGVGNENSPESIFALRDIPNNNFGSRIYMTLHYNQNPSGWNGFTTISDFYDKWDQSDKRFFGEPTPGMQENSGLHFGFLQGQQFDEEGNPLNQRNGQPLIYTEEIPLTAADESRGVRVIKYEPDYGTSVQHPSVDYPLIRFADIWLVKAEALWRKGEDAIAIDMINVLRENRGVSEISSISADGIELLDERGFELYWEGHRRTDLIRFEQFNKEWDQKPQTPDYVKLFAKPQTAVDVNPNLEQNPGY